MTVYAVDASDFTTETFSMIYPYVYFVILLGATIKVIKFTKFTGAPAAAGQVVSSLVQPNKAVNIQNNITNRAPAPLLSGGLFQVTKPAPATATNGQDLSSDKILIFFLF